MPRRRRRRRTRRVVLVVAVVAVLFGAWLAFDVTRGARDLLAVRDDLRALAHDRAAAETSAGRATIVRRLAAASRRADRAADRLDGSVPLRLVGVVPGFGQQRTALVRLSRDTSDAADAARRTVAAAERVAAGGSDGALFPVGPPLDALRQSAADGARTFRRTTRGTSNLWGPVASARRSYDALAAENATRFQDAADALSVAGPFAGGAGRRRYLVLGQNNAEMRDSGMVLSYAVIAVDGGRFTVERRGSVTDLRLRAPADAGVTPAGTDQLFRDLEPTRLWQSVNATADWPWTCRATVAMYRDATGGDAVDGVIAIDVVGLAAVLRITGPVQSEGIPGPITDKNVAKVLLRDLYERLPPGADQGPRREAVAGVAASTVDALGTRRPDPVRLGQALAAAAGGGHLRLCSTHTEEQQTFERLGPGSGPAGPTPETAARTFHYAVQNANGTKLDYDLRTRVTFDVRTTPSDNAFFRTTVTVQNQAPADAGPSYARGPNLGLTDPPGEYVGRVYLWGPAGSDQQGSVVDAGLPVSQALLRADPGGGTASARFETVVRGAAADRLALRLVPQSRLRPADVEVRINGTAVHHGPWPGTIDAKWRIPRSGP